MRGSDDKGPRLQEEVVAAAVKRGLQYSREDWMIDTEAEDTFLMLVLLPVVFLFSFLISFFGFT